MGQASTLTAALVHVFTPRVCTKLGTRLWQCDRWDGVYSSIVQWCLYQLLEAFFFDETKDALEPAVPHLQVTSKIQDASTNRCLWSALLASIWRMEHEIFARHIRFFAQPTGKMFGDTEQHEETQHHVIVALVILANKCHISSLNRSCGSLSCTLWHWCKNLITTCKLHDDDELDFIFFVVTFVTLIRCFQQLLPYLPAEVVVDIVVYGGTDSHLNLK